MNAPITRRALLGATAAVGAVGLPPMALACRPETSAPDADVALVGLIERHTDAAAAWEAACRDLEAARDRAWAAYPPRPAVLGATSTDFMLHGLAPSGRARTPGGRPMIFFNLDDLDRLRNAGPVMSHMLDEDGGSVRPVPNPAGEARRREIVDSYDRWLAERADADRRNGLTAAEAAEEALCVVMEAAEAAVESYVPTTFAGLRVKALWVLARCDLADAAVALVYQLAGTTPPADAGLTGGDLDIAA